MRVPIFKASRMYEKQTILKMLFFIRSLHVHACLLKVPQCAFVYSSWFCNHNSNFMEWCLKNQRNRNHLPLKVKSFERRKKLRRNSTHRQECDAFAFSCVASLVYYEYVRWSNFKLCMGHVFSDTYSYCQSHSM